MFTLIFGESLFSLITDIIAFASVMYYFTVSIILAIRALSKKGYNYESKESD